MLETSHKKLIKSLVLLAVLSVTLLVAPYTSADPINIPKLSALAFFGILSIAALFPVLKSFVLIHFKPLLILLSLFVLQIIFVVLFSGSNFEQQFYGTYGRNTGALTYISLAFLLLATAVVTDKIFVKRVVFLTLIVGALLAVYGQIQHQGLDPLPFVNAYASNVIGTFGNPDFMSAFMGLLAVMVLTMSLNSSFAVVARVGLVALAAFAIFVVKESNAKQGFLNFIAGAGVVVVLWLFMTKRTKLGLAASISGLVGGIFVLLGLINSGPLAGSLYKASLAARELYWRAGITMIKDHPFFGVGMDGFGDWYRRSRTVEDAVSSPGLYSNTAHNVFLDIGSSGGVPLIALYLAILGLAVVSIIMVVKRSDQFDAFFAAIVGAWVAYLAQSFVSINQLGLAIWGWVLSGLIVGYEINTRTPENPIPKAETKKHPGRKAEMTHKPLSSATVLSLFAGLLVAGFVALPPYLTASKYFQTLKTGNAEVIQASAYLKPYDSLRYLQVAKILNENKFEAQAITVIKDAAAKFPDSFEVWSLWASIPSASPEQIAKAKSEMKRLDPFNPELK